jgi:isoquinoline 1-oxidoreductase beta subunit
MIDKAIKTDRRRFLKGGGGLLLALSLPACVGRGIGASGTAAAATLAPNAFVRIGTDDRITLICKFLEMGQGVHTGVATLIAEELDADWDQVSIESAPADLKRYASTIFGRQTTGASASMPDSWNQMRIAGATARAMLVAAAAQRWKVDADGITVESGRVIHISSGRKAYFGELVEAASKLPVPDPAALRLKSPDSYRLIGKNRKRIDSRAKSTGKAVYVADMRMDGLNIAVVLHPPLFGATVRSIDDAAARATDGVIAVVPIPTGVAVIARTTWAAIQGRKALKVEWDESVAELRGDAQIMAEFRTASSSSGALVKEEGNASAAIAGAARRLEMTTELPYLAHACMEPMTCMIALRAEGGCDLWIGTQVPVADQENLAKILDVEPEQVNVHVTLAGGGFGRRSTSTDNHACEAAWIVKARPDLSPLRVQWTREDDIKGGQYRPMFLHRIEAGLDAQGRLSGWRHRIVGQPLFFKPGELDYTSIEGSEAMPYATPKRIELHSMNIGVPIWAWRSVGNSHSAFAIETAIDELAHAAGRDPLEFRRELLAGQPQFLAVLELAADKAGWGSPMAAGRGRGFAMHKLQGTADKVGPYGGYVAQVAEVSVAENGDLKVDRIVCAVDCGLAINPSIVRDQVESSIGYALCATLQGGIRLDRGKVVQSNFYDYPVMRISHMPAIDVHILPSTARPLGVGEPAVPPVAPAVANAIFAASGRRIRALPLLPLDRTNPTSPS